MRLAKLRSALLCVCVLLAIGPDASADPSADAVVGPHSLLINVHAYRPSSGRVLVPLRALANWLGATTVYDAGTITVALGERTVRLRLGRREASVTVSGRITTLQLDQPAEAIDGVTVVPVRFVSESLAAQVGYNLESPILSSPAVEVRQGGRFCRLLIHPLPPSDMAALLTPQLAPKDGVWRISQVADRYKNYASIETHSVEARADSREPAHYDGYRYVRKRDGRWEEIGWALYRQFLEVPRGSIPQDVMEHFGWSWNDSADG